MNESSPAGAARTPWHLWVVGVLTLLWNAVGAFDCRVGNCFLRRA